MDFTGILNSLTGFSEQVYGTERTVAKLNTNLDKMLGITKAEHDAVVGMIDKYNQLGEDIDVFTERMNNTSDPTEAGKYKKKIEDAQRKRLDAEVCFQKKVSGVTIGEASQYRTQNKAAIRQAQGGNKVTQALNGFKASGVVAAIDIAIKVIEFGIGKMTEYMKVSYENELKAMQATTAVAVNAMRANLASWNNAVSGAYEAQSSYLSSTQSVIEAHNAIALANKQLSNTWTNWIPIIGILNKQEEERMRLQQQVAEADLSQATQRIEQINQYTKTVDEYIQKTDDAIHSFGRTMALPIQQINTLETSLLGLGQRFGELNATVEDALRFQLAVQQQSGRAVTYNAEDYTASIAVGQLVGEDTLTQFQSEMTLFNSSVADSADIMYNMYKGAARMGLSQQKVVKDTLSNLKLAEKYQFQGGVRGYLELAKVAENIRLSLASLGSAIEKVQAGGLEGVIKQSAQLQVLGGNFAMNANPLAMAYNSFNNPQGLLDQLYDSIKGMGVYNPETGETTYSGSEQMIIRSAAEAYGMQPEDLYNMGRERRKKEAVNNQLRGSNFTEEERSAIANKAQFNQATKRYEVTTVENGKLVTKDVSEIKTPEDLNNIIGGTNEEKALDYAKQTMSASQATAANTKVISAVFGEKGFDDYIANAYARMDQTFKAFMGNIEGINNVMAKSRKAATDAQAEELKMLGKIETEWENATDIVATAARNAAEALDAMRAELEKIKAGEKAITEAETRRKEATAKASEAAKNGDNETALAAMDEAIRAKNDVHLAKAQDAKNRGGFGWRWNYFVENMRAAKVRANNSGVDFDESTPSAGDVIAQGAGSPMIIGAGQVTSVSDGTAQFARTDAKDTAVFAKTGGPFDKLFDGVFRKIDAVYTAVASAGSGKGLTNIFNPTTIGNIRNAVSNNTTVSDVVRNFATSTASNIRNAVSNAVFTSDEIRNMSNTLYSHISKNGGMEMSVSDLLRLHAMENNNIARIYPDDRNPFTNDMPRDFGLSDSGAPRTAGGTQPNVHIDPININLSGNLTLSGGGTSVDIGKELANNPLLVREIAKLLSESLSAKLYGGKASYNGGQNTYFR